MRWQRVPDLRCHDTETARTITHSPSAWHDIIVVSGVKPGAKGNVDDRYRDVTEIRHGYSRNSYVIGAITTWELTEQDTGFSVTSPTNVVRTVNKTRTVTATVSKTTKNRQTRWPDVDQLPTVAGP